MLLLGCYCLVVIAWFNCRCLCWPWCLMVVLVEMLFAVVDGSVFVAKRYLMFYCFKIWLFYKFYFFKRCFIFVGLVVSEKFWICPAKYCLQRQTFCIIAVIAVFFRISFFSSQLYWFLLLSVNYFVWCVVQIVLYNSFSALIIFYLSENRRKVNLNKFCLVMHYASCYH